MEKLLTIAMEIGEQMLISGAEVHRVEESVKRICNSFGALRTDVFIITSSMVVTVFTEDGGYFTQTRRIKSVGTDYEKLHKLNQLSRRICTEKLDIETINSELEKAKNCKNYPFFIECLCFMVIAAAFTLFFGGNLIEIIISAFVGLLVRIGILFSEKTINSKIFSKFFSSVIATVLAFLVLKLGFVESVDKIIIGNIMTLIPGIGLTNAIRDLFTGDSIAGLLRLIEAVLTALAIAAGYFLVVIVGGAIL